MKNKNLFRNWIILIAVLVFVFLVVKSYRDYLLSPVDSTNKNFQNFVVPQGQGTKEVADRLQKEGLIHSTNAFLLLVQSSGNTGKIQAGDFQLSPSMGARQILEKLKTGTVDKAVTLLEGWRKEQMGDKLSAELGVKSSEFIGMAKEGYMFPDTYMFAPNVQVFQIVEKMEATFNSKYDLTLQNKVKALGLTPEQGIILASIVEREARSSEARRMVASILLKRYKIGMGLNADATVQYALGYQKGEGWWKKNLTKDDLAIDSIYNTYLHVGFPPAPIASPSLSSLQAVANADPKIPYVYYYHDSRGRSHYAKTLDEHNQNVANYP